MTDDHTLALSFAKLQSILSQLGPGAWCGSASDLAAALGLPDIPPNHLTAWIRTWTPLLRKLGIEVQFQRAGHARHRLITLRSVDRPPSTDPHTAGWVCKGCGWYTPGKTTKGVLRCHTCKAEVPQAPVSQ